MVPFSWQGGNTLRNKQKSRHFLSIIFYAINRICFSNIIIGLPSYDSRIRKTIKECIRNSEASIAIDTSYIFFPSSLLK